MPEEKRMSWIIDANGAQALAGTSAFMAAAGKMAEQSRLFDQVVKNSAMFETITELNKRMSDLMEGPMARMAELRRGIELSPMAQPLAGIDKVMPDYQRLIDAMPVLKVNSHMEALPSGYEELSDGLYL